MANKVGRPPGQFKFSHPTRVGGRVTRAYSKYQGMIARCYRVNSHNYKDYGARGVTVDERWRGPMGYDNFFKDMGIPPDGLTLGRINNALPYGPDNCRWETWKEQAQNRRPGGPKPDPSSLKQRAKAAGLAYHVVYLRVKRLGWTEERALTTPTNKWVRLDEASNEKRFMGKPLSDIEKGDILRADNTPATPKNASVA